MASLTCPNCGRDNPDFLDDCQFCQTALRREATLNAGDSPTKKSTGELEKALPDWLQDARQQARDAAEEEAAKEATKPKLQKDDPLDLLAGLAFQAEADEEEVPDWLSAISPAQDRQTPASSKPELENDQPPDFFAQFATSDREDFDLSPTIPLPGKDDATQENVLPWMSGSAGGIETAPPADTPQKDELSDWLSQSSSGPFAFETDEPPARDLTAPTSEEPFDFTPGKPARPEEPEDLSWLRDLEAASQEKPPAPAPSEADNSWMSNLGSPSGTEEDLDWLKNLGGTPAAQPESQPEDLSWLNNLGGTPITPEPAPSETSSTEDDLSWLNTLGGTTPPAMEPAGPAQEDLSWLKDLGGTPIEPSSTGSTPASTDDLSWLKDFGTTPASPSAEPTPAQESLDWLKDLPGIPASEPAAGPALSADDLSWLKDFGGTPETATPSEPAVPQEDLSWLDALGSASAAASPEPSPFAETEVPDWLKDMEARQSLGPVQTSPFTPRNTAPLSENAAPEMPDWLKSATETSKSTSLPPLSAIPRDRKADSGKVAGRQISEPSHEMPAATPQGAPADESVLSTPGESRLGNEDVDALFAVDMPDWLTQPEAASSEASLEQAEGIPSGTADDLAPVDLPSWVQAMRPVEAVINEAADISANQAPEREGPLAGLRGVIPVAPIGSAQRPRAISLKLQASAEQQAGATLVEQIIASEAVSQPPKAMPFISSQNALRWGLAALFLLVLGAVLAVGSPFLPISAALPVEVNNISSAIIALPSGAPVLVVMDYEPSLAGEMEAASGPLLDQLVVLRKPVLTFVATSPNGAGLVDRLLANTRISQPASVGGLDYQAGTQYFNAGYLPGGLAGIRGFTEDPIGIMPSLTGKIDRFSSYQSVIILTDQAETGQMWIEQLTLAKQSDPGLASQQVLVVASGQAGPMLRPYISSQQVAGMISGIADAARFEYVNNSRPGIVRSYWDAFGAGLFLAILSIVLGSLWSLFARIRARRAEAEPG